MLSPRHALTHSGGEFLYLEIMTWASFLAYLGVCVMVTLSPGPDTFLVLRFSLVRQLHGVVAALGMVTAIFAWATLAGAGAASLMQRYPVIESIIAMLGGLYLMYLGLSGFLKSRAVAKADSAIARTETRAGARMRGQTLRRSFVAGVLSAALNPKLGLLFLAMMPSFIPKESSTLLWGMGLGAIFAAVGFLYLLILSAVASKAMQWFKKPEITLRLEWTACAALFLMGIGVLLSAFL
ncbi:lysine transporter LysE [Arthrobacter sp. MYb211]|uniref:LysE family translocator n=2 Tax=Micrococcales TaxID=85006 RepID=UPI000CFCD8D7|nr:LysE family translocator [Arthrobacter sp. MYb224]PRA00452.1 lysine transporter LysE [Arthrobacter sp. MYb224]PRA10613.1 lysine transporter LysE [Arthrobacter sp. MYb221]PRC06303.1 lysine transporter LysE [Arthrobacter sp. MYb211]